MPRIYVIFEIPSSLDLLVRAMETISMHARELRAGATPEHKIILQGPVKQGPERAQIVGYLKTEQQRMGARLVLSDGRDPYALPKTDLNPSNLIIGVFKNGATDSAIDFIAIGT